MELIRVENVYKTYHVGEIDVPVLKGVSFSIRRGEMVALMGASGSGKSTLMNILGCLDRPSSGHYWFDGEEVGGLASDDRALVRTAKLGFVFQSFNLLPRTTALDNVLMPLDYAIDAPSAAKRAARAAELLCRVGLEDRARHVPSQMSGGQQQRVAIARALVNRPALLLADEPTGNLDSHTSVEVLEMFRQLHEVGITVVLVTHDAKVASYADRIINMVDGLIEEDNTHRVRASPPRNGDTIRADVEHPAPIAPAAIASDGTGHPHENGDDLPWTSGGGGSAVRTAARIAANTQAAVVTEVERPPAAVSQRAKSAARTRGRIASALLPASLRTAFNALRRNKMRSALTTLGIVIGVAAVIAMVEIGQGSRRVLLETIASMGANNVIIESGAVSSSGISFGSGSEKTLTPGDADEIARQCPAIMAVAPMVQVHGQVVRGNRNWIPMAIYGSTPSYLIVRDWKSMDEGDMFTERDVAGANKVCVIGATLARELFENESPIGKDIRVLNVSLRVVGVLARKGASMLGFDQDDFLVAPWTTVKYRISGTSAGGSNRGAGSTSGNAASAGSSRVNSLNNLYPGTVILYPQQSESQAANTPMPVRFSNVDEILAKAGSADMIPEAMTQISALLRERHRLRDDQDDDFQVIDLSEIIKTFGSVSQMMGGLLLIVALISLAVGGVGIMNIMLVSVTERTREIGLRMAVGARGYHILRQFLIEAVVLCLFGGLVGVMLGRGAATLVWYLLRWPIEASLPAIAAAFIVSAIVGIAFGFYPAWKASRLDPIEALRYE